MKSFRDLSIRMKLFLLYSGIFVIALAVGGSLLYSVMKNEVESRIRDELKKQTEIAVSLLRTAADASIRYQLRYIAEENRRILGRLNNAVAMGVLSESEAKKQAGEILSQFHIGDTGYVYCTDGNGVIRVHPEASLIGTPVPKGLLQKIVEIKKEGYLEYSDQIPGVTCKGTKALSVAYFEPWDWIVCALACRDDMVKAVPLSDYIEKIRAFQIGGKGLFLKNNNQTFFILESDLESPLTGDYLIHQNKNFLQSLYDQKQGTMVHSWKNEGSNTPRKDLVVFDYIKDLNMIVAATGSLHRVREPLYLLRWIIVGMAFGTLLLVVPSTMLVSNTITKQLAALVQGFYRGVGGDFSVRMDSVANDEIGQISRHFNTFMEKLETKTSALQEEIRERSRIEEELRSLSNHMQKVREEEGTRIAREIHDDLGQTLTACKIELSWMQKKVEDPLVLGKIESVLGLIDRSIWSIQRISSELRPGMLDDLGLQAAIEWQAEEFQERTGVDCNLDLDFDENVLSKDKATAFFRIFQEALTNIARHAGASKVSVALKKEAGNVILEIGDNGIGITGEEINDPKSYGIIGMRERVQLWNGNVTITGAAGEGTCVKVAIPAEEDMDGDKESASS